MPRLVLASASPARLATLRAAGLDPEVVVSGVDESDVGGGAAYVAGELATRKARTVAATAQAVGAYVVGCDSVLEFDGAVYGKPRGAHDARDRWRAMRGRSGVLHTGHCLVTPAGTTDTRVAATTVFFAAVSDAEIDAYIATGEPLAVAGAFTLDGLGAAFVTGIEGNPHNVVGINVALLRLMADAAGLHWPDLWRAT